jgi:predicted DCC family thiol-disulfide oxidoreductase YuxK
MTAPSPSSHAITLLYDGDCPFCVKEVRWLKKRDADGALGTVDIAAPEFDPSVYGLTHDQAMAKMHGVLPDGSILTGMAVFRKAYQQVGLGWLIAPTGWPGLRWLSDLGYRWFARNRVRLDESSAERRAKRGTVK